MVEMVESALTSYFIWKSSAEVKPGNLRAGLKPIRDATLALARKIQRLDSVTRISFVAANCQSDFETFSKSFNRLSRSIKVKPGRKPDWPLARTVGSLCLTFNRQNLGIYAMFLRSAGQVPMSRVERIAFDALCAGGILVALTLYPDTSGGLGPWGDALIICGQPLFAACACMLVIEAVKLGRMRSATCTGWLLLSILFFFPTVFSYSAAVGIAFYAHPLQYVVMMFVVSGARAPALPGGRALRIAALCGLGAVACALVWLFQYGHVEFARGERVALALTIGLTQWHLLADAGLWRMRDAVPRRNFEQSFACMFTPPRGAAPAGGAARLAAIGEGSIAPGAVAARAQMHSVAGGGSP